jgi:hydroxymethylglutaryl-CoA synthase
MLYNDYLADPSHPQSKEVGLELRDIDYQASLTDKNVEKTFMALTKKRFAERVQPAIQVATMCGNMYCGSVYGGLVGLISNIPSKTLQGKRLGVFSYGSGLASSMFSLKVVGDTTELADKLQLQQRLDARRVVPPQVYDDMCMLREKAHLKKDFKPVGKVEDVLPGTYYLTEVDDMFRRKYEIKA